MATAIQTLQELITREAPGSPAAMYLTGSYCDGGLRPESDLDILLITRVPLQVGERRIHVGDTFDQLGAGAAGRLGERRGNFGPGWAGAAGFGGSGGELRPFLFQDQNKTLP